MSGVRAVLFDFNGTLSDDEPVLCAIFCALFAELGRPLTPEAYFAELAGRSDPEIVRRWLGEGRRDEAAIVDEVTRRYCDAAADGATITPGARAAVSLASARGHVGIVSGALRVTIEAVLHGAGLATAFDPVVAAEDVRRGKPDPEGYLAALARLDGLAAHEVLVVEDSGPGVAAARAAGMRVAGVLGTTPRAGLAAADVVLERLDAAGLAAALDGSYA
jgi:HAD superfamily hydrolase (TIGR01509 family)